MHTIPFPDLKNIIVVSILLFSIASCNTLEKREMKDPLSGTIVNIKENDRGFNLVIKTDNDSTVLASLMSKDHKVLSGIVKDQKIKFKGMVYYSDSRNIKDSNGMLKKSYFDYNDASGHKIPFIVIKELSIVKE